MIDKFIEDIILLIDIIYFNKSGDIIVGNYVFHHLDQLISQCINASMYADLRRSVRDRV